MSQAGPCAWLIVLNHNGWSDTMECVESLLRSDYPKYRVLIIDNGSTDDSVSRLRPLTGDGKVSLVETGSNKGCPGGINVGIKQALEAGADYIFTIHNDLVAAADAVASTIAAMESDRSIGVAAPKILYYADKSRIWSCGGWMNRWLARASMILSDAKDDPRDRREIDADILVGCAMCFRREMLEAVGLWDERYFFQNEEYEFFDRVRKSGWRVKVVLGTFLLHKIGRTIGAGSYDRWYYGTRNRLLYIKENLPWPQRLTASLFFWSTRPLKFAQWILNGRIDLIRATFDGWADYRRGKLGQHGRPA